jgi:hypothetical protein
MSFLVALTLTLSQRERGKMGFLSQMERGKLRLPRPLCGRG